MNLPGREVAGESRNEQSVRERAYFIWEREGKPHGRDRDHWAMAERELFSAGMIGGAAKLAAKPNGKGAQKTTAGTGARAAAKAKAASRATAKTGARTGAARRVARTTISAAKSPRPKTRE